MLERVEGTCYEASRQIRLFPPRQDGSGAEPAHGTPDTSDEGATGPGGTGGLTGGADYR